MDNLSFAWALLYSFKLTIAATGVALLIFAAEEAVNLIFRVRRASEGEGPGPNILALQALGSEIAAWLAAVIRRPSRAT